MGYLIVALVLLMSSSQGCATSFDADRAEGQQFVDANLPIGTGVERALHVLREHELVHRVFSPAECDVFVVEPRFRCLGGSGVVATVASDINPWNPIYSPDLRVFMAFGSEETLRETILYIDGGDG